MMRGLETVAMGLGNTMPKNHILHSATETSKNDAVVSKIKNRQWTGITEIKPHPPQKNSETKSMCKACDFYTCLRNNTLNR
jgi:hypothetical protein